MTELLADNPRALVALAALLWAAGYVLACAVWPFTSHGHCNGTGKMRSPSGRAWRPCRGCGGSGTKLRIGRRAWGALNATARRRP